MDARNWRKKVRHAAVQRLFAGPSPARACLREPGSRARQSASSPHLVPVCSLELGLDLRTDCAVPALHTKYAVLPLSHSATVPTRGLLLL